MSGLFGFLRKWMGGGATAPADMPVTGAPARVSLASEMLLAPARDLSENHPQVIAALSAGPAGQDDYADPRWAIPFETTPNFARLAAALDAAGLLVTLHQSASLKQSAAALRRLFAHHGLVTGSALNGLDEPDTRTPGATLAAAYTAVSPIAETAQRQLINLNCGTRAFHLVLPPSAAAEKWVSMRLDPASAIEDCAAILPGVTTQSARAH